MKARSLIETDRLGAWWREDSEDDEAAALKRQARAEEQSKLQTAMNRVAKMEPSSRNALDLLLHRDDLVKERSARQQLQDELKKFKARVEDVEEFITREPGRLDNMIKTLGGGPDADAAGKKLPKHRCPACPHDLGASERGDIIGFRIGGVPQYFSKPIKQHPGAYRRIQR